MEFQAVVQKASKVTSLYDQLNEEQGRPKWGIEQYAQGLVEDVGTLTRLTQMKLGIRASAENLDEKLRHEVCDCLWSVIRIADSLNIDLDTEFPRQMDILAKRIIEEKR